MLRRGALSVVFLVCMAVSAYAVNSYYNHGSFPPPSSPATSAGMRAEFDLIAQGFDKLPQLSGNGGKHVVVNAGGTALETTSATTFATLAGTETLTNKTLTSPVLSGTATGTYTLGGTPTISSLLTLSSGQLKFPSSQNASADGNTLDDYEEGTWTPSLGGTATYIAVTGRYVKIGRMVHVTGYLQVNALGTGSPHTISGLPFVAAGGIHNVVTVHAETLAVAVVSLTGYITSGTSTVTVVSRTGASTSADTNNIFGALSVVMVSGWYETT